MSVAGSESSSSSDFGDCRVIMADLERPFAIRLWEDRTRGEEWVPTYDPTQLTLLGDEYVRIAGNNAVDNGARTFEFRAVAPGVHQLVFEKRMGWKFTAEDRRVFRIHVADQRGS